MDFAALSHQNALWVMGGLTDHVEETCFVGDVWRSGDGTNWAKAVDVAPWGKRGAMSSLAYQGKMWIMGGDSLMVA